MCEVARPDKRRHTHPADGGAKREPSRYWNGEGDIVGSVSFCYIADCKLATRDNMDHIAGNGGRFVTILPRTRTEDRTGRAWIAAGEVCWVEIARHPVRRKEDPDRV